MLLQTVNGWWKGEITSTCLTVENMLPNVILHVLRLAEWGGMNANLNKTHKQNLRGLFI